MTEGKGRGMRCRRWGSGAMIAAMAALAVPAGASLSPGKWTVQRIVAVKDDAWIAIHSRRNHTSYYRYRSTAEVRVTRTGTGCIVERRSLGSVIHKDVAANGRWTRTVVAPGQSQPFGVMRGAVVVLPVGGRERLSLTSGAVMLRYGDRSYELVSAANIARWAGLAGITLNDEVRIAELVSPSDDLSRPQPSFVVVETRHRDIDADYARFVVPVNLHAFQARLDRGVTDRAGLAVGQPQPTGC